MKCRKDRKIDYTIILHTALSPLHCDTSRRTKHKHKRQNIHPPASVARLREELTEHKSSDPCLRRLTYATLPLLGPPRHCIVLHCNSSSTTSTSACASNAWIKDSLSRDRRQHAVRSCDDGLLPLLPSGECDCAIRSPTRGRREWLGWVGRLGQARQRRVYSLARMPSSSPSPPSPLPPVGDETQHQHQHRPDFTFRPLSDPIPTFWRIAIVHRVFRTRPRPSLSSLSSSPSTPSCMLIVPPSSPNALIQIPAPPPPPPLRSDRIKSNWSPKEGTDHPAQPRNKAIDNEAKRLVV
jgi:hypothetical protein